MIYLKCCNACDISSSQQKMPKPVRFLRFMPKIVQEYEKAVMRETYLAGVAQGFDIPLRLLLDFQQLPGRSNDIEFTDMVIAGLRRLIQESTGHHSKILAKYLERKALSHINRKTRHFQRSLLAAAPSKVRRP